MCVCVVVVVGGGGGRTDPRSNGSGSPSSVAILRQAERAAAVGPAHSVYSSITAGDRPRGGVTRAVRTAQAAVGGTPSCRTDCTNSDTPPNRTLQPLALQHLLQLILLQYLLYLQVAS